MSITDELRAFFDGADGYELWCPHHKKELTMIADRIDAEAKDNELFRREAEPFGDRLREAAAERADVTLFGVDYVALPLDADGEAIHLQDRMSWDNGTFDVHELKLDADGWTTWDEVHGYTVRADQCHHVKPDSWERIIEDAQADGVRWHNDGRPSDFDALVERCKRLAGEDE